MLQWMGGSRRKVTRSQSRKSTYKRQKQYFEQRKRQLQQQTAGLDSYSDGKGSCTLHCGNNRSLDILSLENISTLVHKHKSSRINARENSEHNDFTSNHQDAHPSLVNLNNQGILVDQSELNEETTSSSYITEDEHSEKVLVHLPDRNEEIAGNNKKLDSFKASTDQISVFDILGDDGGANNNEEENSFHAQEAHVSFSVEGLGKVEMETPVHSPRIPGSYFPNCFSPHKKTRRQPISAKHLDYDFYDLGSGVDIDFSPYDSSIDQPFCSRDVMNIVGNPSQKSESFRMSSPNNWNGCDLQGVFNDDELTCYIRGSSRNIRNGCVCPSFLDDSIDDLGEYEPYLKNWVDQRNTGFDDYLHCKDHWMQDLNSEGWDLQKKRSSAKRTGTFNMKEAPVPHPKHRTTEDLPDVIFSDKMWSSTIENSCHTKDAVNHFAREDAMESMSILSEESCSSTAVRGDSTRNS